MRGPHVQRVGAGPWRACPGAAGLAGGHHAPAATCCPPEQQRRGPGGQPAVALRAGPLPAQPVGTRGPVVRPG